MLRTAVVPVPAVGSALLLALVALWFAGAIAEWSARRYDASLGAIAPSLVLFVAIAALADEGWVWSTVTYGLAVTLYLVALHQSELTERRSWFHTGEKRQSKVLQGGIIGALAVVLAAAVVTPLLPGSRSDAWFDYRSLGNGGNSAAQGHHTHREHPGQVAREPRARGVHGRHRRQAARVLAIIALDKYDGTLWTLEDTGEPAARSRRPASRATWTSWCRSSTSATLIPTGCLRHHPVEINLERALGRQLRDRLPEAEQRDQ